MRKEFGEYLRDLRKEQAWSIRGFARETGLDPSNLSRIERGMAPPPLEGALMRIAATLGILDTAEDERWFALKYRADVSRGVIPTDLLARDDVVEQLPSLFEYFRQIGIAQRSGAAKPRPRIPQSAFDEVAMPSARPRV